MINISYRDTTIDYIILIAILLSGVSGGTVKLQRMSGDSRDPIIAQAHNDNECGGPRAGTLDPGPFPASIVALPSNWTAARHRRHADFSSGSSLCLSGANNQEKCVRCSHSGQ